MSPRPGAQRHNSKPKERYGRGGTRQATRFIRLSRAAIKLENSIYFAHAGSNVGRTRDEINLRSFLGIKSDGSAKFGLQPAGEASRPLNERDTHQHANAALWGYLICASLAPLYFTWRWWNGLFSLDSPFLRKLGRDLPWSLSSRLQNTRWFFFTFSYFLLSLSLFLST